MWIFHYLNSPTQILLIPILFWLILVVDPFVKVQKNSSYVLNLLLQVSTYIKEESISKIEIKKKKKMVYTQPLTRRNPKWEKHNKSKGSLLHATFFFNCLERDNSRHGHLTHSNGRPLHIHNTAILSTLTNYASNSMKLLG